MTFFSGLMDPKIIKLEKSKSYFYDRGWIIEPKISGRRIQAWINDNKVQFAGRYGIEGREDLNALNMKLRHLADELRAMKIPNGTLIDGEVHIPGLPFGAAKVINSNPDDAITYQQEVGFLRYTLFDAMLYRNIPVYESELSSRFQTLNVIINESKHVDVIKRLPNDGSLTWDHVTLMGLEGLVFKDIDSLYYEHRSKSWRKLKVSESYDAIITGMKLSASGERIASFEAAQYIKGKITHVANVGNIPSHIAKDIEGAEQLIGQVLQFRADMRTDKSYKNPRFECFRDDKLPTSCLWENEE